MFFRPSIHGIRLSLPDGIGRWKPGNFQRPFFFAQNQRTRLHFPATNRGNPQREFGQFVSL
jgi:hypothetical protein